MVEDQRGLPKVGEQHTWEDNGEPRGPDRSLTKVTAGLSLGLWLAVILLGRLLPGFSLAARPGAFWFERVATP